MASNVADLWLWFPAQAVASVTNGISVTAPADVSVTTGLTTGVIGGFLIPSRVQVKQFGVVVSLVFPTFTADPVITLQKLGGTAFGTTTALATLTLAATSSTFKTSFNRSAVAAGGPGTVVTAPMLTTGTVVSADTEFTAGTVLVGPDLYTPTAMINPGEWLQVSVTTQGTTAGTAGKYQAFVRLEVAGEQALELTNVFQQVS